MAQAFLGATALMLQFAAAGPVDDDAPLPPPLVDTRPLVVLDPYVERLLDCISYYESKHTPSATNPISKAAGQYQFLWSTWNGTPQGRAGLSPYDPIASRQAARWMIGQGRKYEWVPVARGLCR